MLITNFLIHGRHEMIELILSVYKKDMKYYFLIT